jgi:hypothetical protein
LRKLEQDCPRKWKLFCATLSGPNGVPPADSKSSFAAFGVIDNTMHFRIEARNFTGVTDINLVVLENGNVIADLLKSSEYVITKQGTMIVKGSIGKFGLLFGSSAGIIAAGISAKFGYPITFNRWFRIGFPFMIISVAIGMVSLIFFTLLTKL